jgi:Cytochrome c3
MRPAILRGSIIALVVLAATAAAAGAGTVWLKHRIQTPEYCSNCHAVAPYYDTWKASPYTAHAHEEAGLACQFCHTRTVRDGLRELVNTVTHNYEVPLKDHKVGARECLRCHGTYEYLASLTNDLKGPDGFPLGRNPHDSHWGSLDCGICHKMHKPSVEFCAVCHSFPIQGPSWQSRTGAAGLSAER